MILDARLTGTARPGDVVAIDLTPFESSQGRRDAGQGVAGSISLFWSRTRLSSSAIRTPR
jgi:hypothetical protein